MKPVLEGHGGMIEKYIGDAIMAVFGLPRMHEDDAQRAVRAAARMREALAELNVTLRAEFGVTLENRTGVNTGEVVTGEGGGSQRLATGDTVNVAARLEQAAPTGEVLIGESTYRLVRDAVEVVPVEPLTPSSAVRSPGPSAGSSRCSARPGPARAGSSRSSCGASPARRWYCGAAACPTATASRTGRRLRCSGRRPGSCRRTARRTPAPSSRPTWASGWPRRPVASSRSWASRSSSTHRTNCYGPCGPSFRN